MRLPGNLARCKRMLYHDAMMDLSRLEEILADLRRVRDDHQTVEAKRAEAGLPSTTWETLCAFANSAGGVLLLGVDEASGFSVSGLGDPGKIAKDVANVCNELEPPLRPVVDIIHHPDGAVVAVHQPALPKELRPCHRRKDGPTAAFIRVADGDRRLLPSEVAEMLASRTHHDHSRNPASTAVALDPGALSVLDTSFRTNAKLAEYGAAELREHFGVTVHGHPTIAGALTVGIAPQGSEAAADVVFARAPKSTDPVGTRMAGSHLQGTIGELLDQACAAIESELGFIQVEREGRVVDETDVPRIVIREIVGNALLHRSFSAGMAGSNVKIDVADEAVIVTSPGGLHYAADTATLGLNPVPGVRNHTLVNLAIRLTTPSGARIVEHQSSGVAAADRACREAGTMPALFVDEPASFQVVLLRGRLDYEGARVALTAAGLQPTPEATRLLAIARRLDRLRDDAAGLVVGAQALDERFAARALPPLRSADTATLLAELERGGLLTRRQRASEPTWEASAPLPVDERDGRLFDVLESISRAGGALSAAGIGEACGFASTRTRTKWIDRAVGKEWVVSSTENPYDRTKTFSLTAQGTAALARHRSRS